MSAVQVKAIQAVARDGGFGMRAPEHSPTLSPALLAFHRRVQRVLRAHEAVVRASTQTGRERVVADADARRDTLLDEVVRRYAEDVGT